jgi:hypothetical protein
MEQNTYGAAASVRTEPHRVRSGAGERLGSYLAAGGWRELRGVDDVEHGICVVDEGDEHALLVEPGLEQMAEARAIAADYLALASELGTPQVTHPWPPSDAGSAAEQS